MINWLRYSGIAVILQFNPLHWKIIPWIIKESNIWAGPKEHTWSMGFLFLTIRLWVDNGDW